MNPVTVVTGTMAPLDRADVDTDQIMPKQFLKRVDRSGFGDFLFADWRADPVFVLNRPEHRDARVLVTGPNFGCGSSREHAAWGLQQWGFQAIVAPSFADIFRTNCAKIGLLTVVQPPAVCSTLARLAAAAPQTRCRIDLPGQRLQADAVDVVFDIDPHTKRMLVSGLDDIALTLQHADAITDHERRRPAHPVVTSVG